mmetsp:Transcript_43999/g.127249  ORF Transcript_43999/g.127249 Transcript_43999/m.127249 type:complete len:83 (-) Transcript_43999:79-327(-)
MLWELAPRTAKRSACIRGPVRESPTRALLDGRVAAPKRWLLLQKARQLAAELAEARAAPSPLRWIPWHPPALALLPLQTARL